MPDSETTYNLDDWGDPPEDLFRLTIIYETYDQHEVQYFESEEALIRFVKSLPRDQKIGPVWWLTRSDVDGPDFAQSPKWVRCAVVEPTPNVQLKKAE